MRAVTGYYTAKGQHWVGDGFPVRTLLSHHQFGAAASPFLMLDHAGPHVFEPKLGDPRGVGSHPHKGFETVTIVYEGEVEHRDSTGAGGLIGPGDVQWMTAGSGIIHEEFHSPEFTRKGGRFEMAQLWVNLPAADKSAPAGYQNITSDMIPMVKVGKMQARIIAGDFDGTKGPAKTFTPINVWDVKGEAGTTLTLPMPSSHQGAVVVLRGRVTMADFAFVAGDTLTLGMGDGRVEMVVEEEATLLILSGEPIAEPIVAYGPFVMNTEDEIREAIVDFNAGRFGRIA